MINLFLRGVLLPLIFFVTIPIHAQKPISELYDVFYNDINSYKKWLKSDRSNTIKDVFINLYNLPANGERKYSNNVKIKVHEGLSDGNIQNAYSYLEFNERSNVNLVIWGIREGTVKINGAERGTISKDSDTGFALLKGVFEKGAYFISFNIKKRFAGVPVKVLSDKKVKISQRGFNRKAVCSVKLYNIKPKYPEVNLSDLYRGFCFPYSKENYRKTFYTLMLKKESQPDNRNSLFYNLYALTVNDKNKSKLEKVGFDEKQIKWWKKQLFEKEVCGYE